MLDSKMTTQLDLKYYGWLISQVQITSNRTYFELFERMHNLEFVWFVPNDDNRIQDGLDLRTEFLDGRHGKLHLGGATVLEVLIALSRRTAFTAGGKAEHWAWKLLKNLRLNKMFDPLTDQARSKIDDILEALVWRTYQTNGRGGFFPVTHSLDDQTKLEIWYQMNVYVMEMQDH